MELEAELGMRLLHRTTRKVQPTQEDQAFYGRCKDLLADVDEVQTTFQQQGVQNLRGRVRIDMSTGMARHAVIPRLPERAAGLAPVAGAGDQQHRTPGGPGRRRQPGGPSAAAAAHGECG